MKILPKAVETFLQAPDKDQFAVLLYGPDAGLVRERTKRIADKLLGAANDPFALVELTEAKLLADPALLSDELGAISLMGGKRVIMVRDASDKLTKIIEGAKDALHSDAFLIISADELSTRSSLRSLFEKETSCAAIACYNDEARDVLGVIRKRFEEASIRADRDVIEYLASQLGNDRYVTYSELDKLITYAGDEKQIRLEDARALVDYNRETNLDDVVNAVADKNVQALDAVLTLLLREGGQPVAWLRAMQRYFNRLYYIRAQMDEGKSADQVIAGLRPPVFFRQLPILTRHVQNWESTQLIKAMKLLTEAELACKTSDLPIMPASSRKVFQVTQLR